MQNTPTENPPIKLLDQVSARIRVKHYSRRTEQVYVDWIKRDIVHYDKSLTVECGVNVWSDLRGYSATCWNWFVRSYYLRLSSLK